MKRYGLGSLLRDYLQPIQQLYFDKSCRLDDAPLGDFEMTSLMGSPFDRDGISVAARVFQSQLWLMLDLCKQVE